jgi:hypothetical protein
MNPSQNTKEISLSIWDYNVLFSALRDAHFVAIERGYTDDVEKYEELIEKFSNLTRTMNWLCYRDEVVVGMTQVVSK